ncbi:hypothetical protein RJ639_045596 [Escallonia herrerae]|uniref:Integrase catalytic domain-containing protein n=1 Tax=Escallonia herrerae TaxID=1293975 RepID=A0AA88WDF6_9ASTE|nr:hypothetical protein RJ639_045596 [Escallonia herrerae]
MAEEGKGKIEKFNGMNFQWWKMQVEDYLYQKDLYLPLVGEKPEAMNASEWAILDRKAIVGKGKVKIKLSNGGTLVLKDVRHIPELQKNLISVSGLDHEGYFVAFGEKQWKVTKGSMVVARGERVRTLYTLSDDASRKTWIYAIRQKSDVYHTFKKWKVLIENETGNKVKCLKSDNGGEYRDGGFQGYCSNNGIRLIRTVKRTPQENGLAERMNRTIMERAMCMRIHADLPLQFWAAAVDPALYLINRSPLSALNGGIPEEEWSGKPVNYSFLRVFGCIAYAHINKEERKKLDSKSQKCVFIGYGGDEYGYRLWDYEHNKIIRSRDVIFDESQLYKHKLQEHGIKKDNREYMELDEPEDGQVPRTENPEVLDETTDTEIGAGDQQQVPETLNLRRSSQSAIHLAKNLAFHSRTKHIQLRYHFIRSLLEDGQLNLEKIEGNKNPADMLTKVVDRQKLSLCSTLISLR